MKDYRKFFIKYIDSVKKKVVSKDISNVCTFQELLTML